MRRYMELNTGLRIIASTVFWQKLLLGHIFKSFGKTCETKRNRDQVVIVRNAQIVLQRTQNFQFKLFKIFREESIAALKIVNKQIYWN